MVALLALAARLVDGRQRLRLRVAGLTPVEEGAGSGQVRPDRGLQQDGRPELVVGVPVPVLDESTERFWWDTGSYFLLPAANPPKRGQHWYYAYARTLPGYPTLTRDHDGPGVR